MVWTFYEEDFELCDDLLNSRNVIVQLHFVFVSVIMKMFLFIFFVKITISD